MSRHEIPSHKDPKLTVVIGWDPPLSTFFAQVKDPLAAEDDEDESDPILLWTGTSYGEHRGEQGLRAVISLLAPWAKVGEALRRQLLADAEEGR